MRRLALVLALVSGCGGSAAGDGGETTADTTAADAGSTSASADTADTMPADASATTTSTTGVDTSAATPGEDDDGADTTDTTGGPPLVGCPDALPAAWILCEDFESITDPGAQLGQFLNIGEQLAIEDGPAVSGTRSYRVEHRPDSEWGGWLELRFGAGPGGGTVHRPEERFDEVWVRFWVRRDADWPDGGFGDLVEVQALAPVPGNSAIAVDGTVLGPTATPQAQLIAWSCIEGGMLQCDGDDWSDPDLQSLDATLGAAPLFGAAAADTWQCVEVHMRLDGAGGPGGIELFVDGRLDAALDGVEWVQSWTDVGINNVRFSSWWPDVPATIRRHIDDVVVATAPIGCD
jgi:hypothetical protein